MDASWLTLALAATAAAGLFVDAWLARLPGAPDGLSIEADRTPAPDAPAAVAAGQTPLAWRTRLSVAAVSTFVRRHFHDFAVAAAVAAAGLYTWVFFPRPGPDIRPGQIGSLFNGLRFIFELAGRHADAWAGLVGGAALGAALGLVIMAAAAQRAGRPAAARRRAPRRRWSARWGSSGWASSASSGCMPARPFRSRPASPWRRPGRGGIGPGWRPTCSTVPGRAPSSGSRWGPCSAPRPSFAFTGCTSSRTASRATSRSGWSR